MKIPWTIRGGINSRFPNAIIITIVISISFLAGNLQAAEAKSDSTAKVETSESASKAMTSPWTSLRPRQVLVGPQIGFTGSWFNASPQYQALIEPTPARDNGGTALSLGAVLTARWSHWFTLSVAPHRETYRMETHEGTVAFPDNPFPHSLHATTDLSYNVWPLTMGIGWFTARQHFQVQLGAYTALLDHAEIHWIVDGQEYSNLPPTNYNTSLSGWILGSEYGLRLGPGDLVVGMDTQREFQTLMTGLEGSLKARSVRMHLGYAWEIWSR